MHPGGSDTNVVREFDIATRSFVPEEQAFIKPNSKGTMRWVDRDRVVISADFGAESVTASGYPISARLWSRGEKLADATEIIRGEFDDVVVAASYDHTPGHEKLLAQRATDFRNTIVYDVDIAKLANGEPEALRPIKLPSSAMVSVVRNWVIAELRYPWEVHGQTYPAGCLLAIDYASALSGPTPHDIHLMYEPNETSSLLSVSPVASGVVFTTLDDVRGRFWFAHYADSQWHILELHPQIPEFSTASIAAVDSHIR